MEIPSHITSQIAHLIEKAKSISSSSSESSPKSASGENVKISSTSLREHLLMGLTGKIDTKLEEDLLSAIDETEDPTSNEYLMQIHHMLEDYQKGKLWDVTG